jgi:hypothetical protein
MKKKPGTLINSLVIAGMYLVILNSCKKDNKYDPITPGLMAGQFYKGGVIAYILQQGDSGYVPNEPHGLIAAPYDQSAGIQWDNGCNKVTGAAGIAIGTGTANTNTIVGIKGDGSYAAKLCYDLVLDGVSGWYLPSKDELEKLFQNKDLIGGFAPTPYWSSTESLNNYAWHECFSNGYQSNTNMGNLYHVRAVRAF